MSQVVVCQACKYKLRVPSRLAGRRVTCPKCGQAVQAPELPPPSPEEAAKPPPPDPSLPVPEIPLAVADRCGQAGLMLGLVSILVLFLVFCLGHYAMWSSVGLSGLGLFLSVCGLIGSGFKEISRRIRGRAPDANVRRDLPVSYPIAGSALCTFALALALWPWWINSMKQPGPRTISESSAEFVFRVLNIPHGAVPAVLHSSEEHACYGLPPGSWRLPA
jgi:hypothetical protein